MGIMCLGKVWCFVWGSGRSIPKISCSIFLKLWKSCCWFGEALLSSSPSFLINKKKSRTIKSLMSSIPMKNSSQFQLIKTPFKPICLFWRIISSKKSWNLSKINWILKIQNITSRSAQSMQVKSFKTHRPSFKILIHHFLESLETNFRKVKFKVKIHQKIRTKKLFRFSKNILSFWLKLANNTTKNIKNLMLTSMRLSQLQKEIDL